jgi:hypothetical protein
MATGRRRRCHGNAGGSVLHGINLEIGWELDDGVLRFLRGAP